MRVKSPEKLLSKSTFIRSLQCQKSLYMYKTSPELADKRSADTLALFARGHSIGELAQKLFPGGVDVGWKDPRQYKKSVKKTRELIEEGCRVIYEAAFLHEGVLVAIDILVKDAEGWKGYEVKSSAYASETYLRDAALQYHVITGSGIPLVDMALVHLDKSYVHSGRLELEKVFKINSVLGQVIRRQGMVERGLRQARETLYGGELPQVDIGPHCQEPYPCDFQGVCWGHIPSLSIFALSELEDEAKWHLYKNEGVLLLDSIHEDFPLPEKAQRQREALLGGVPYTDAVQLAAFCKKPRYPLGVLDMLSFRPGIPLVRGTRPYANLPFGFTVLKYASPDSVPETCSFLAEAGQDVEEKFLKHFLAATEGLSALLSYGQGQEWGALNDLSKKFPHFSAALKSRIALRHDLSKPFAEKWFYHPAQGAKHDLPTVLAALDLSGEAPPEGSIPSPYLAGAVFEKLYAERDIWEIPRLRGLLQDFSLRSAEEAGRVWRFLREQTKLPTI